MVHKTCHRGVHSGNTLRAFNSRHSRRYHSQSCIVSRIHPELLHKLAGGKKADDKRPETGNIAVDVPLSLNKQSRWRLPSALIRQIDNNDIGDSELTVSLLERHKLKQHASCVSFHSNKGEVRRIQPRNGRYFGFNYRTIGGTSRRALRRERREELKSKGQGDKKMGKTVQVYTEQGAARRGLDLGKSEVRYEVYYPSPAQSSISHNLKYIKQDVAAAPGEEDEHVQHGKPKKQHRGKQRKRMSLKDLDDCDLPSHSAKPRDQSLPLIPDQEECALLEGSREKENTTECLLTTLLEKAQQLQHFKGVVKSRHRKKVNKSSPHYEHDKSHIVYLGDSDSEMHTSPTKSTFESSPLVHPISPIPSEVTRVMLPKDDVTLTSLKECFGQKYAEAACKPRKFVLDVTQNVVDVLKKRGLATREAEKSGDTYLICIHDGFYDDEYDVYKILLNSRWHKGLLTVQINTTENQDLYRGTLMNLISETMDFVESVLMGTIKAQNQFPAVHRNIVKPTDFKLNSHLGSAEAYVPSVQRFFQLGSDNSGITMPTLEDLLQEDPVFCDVCYDDISPLTHGSAAYTSLLKCQHRVCDSCWSHHIHTRFHEGFVRLTCPGYDCQEEVKVPELLSLVSLDIAEKALQRQEEVCVGGSQTKKWCPNESCGRVISLQPSSSSGKFQLQQDIVCACGLHVCFQCLMPAHWPASCKQAEEYRVGLATAVFPDRQAEVHDDSEVERDAKLKQQITDKKTMVVEGKQCPKCNSFVFKDGGCPQMMCRCGQLFCWRCGKPGFSHIGRQGCADAEQQRKATTTLIVRHLEASPRSEGVKEEKQSLYRRQRMSLMERAVEHRKQSQLQSLRVIALLARTVASAAAKDKALTQQIIKTCTEAFPSSCCKPLAETPVPESVMETVSSFLKNVARSKQELHEVVEYSLVLLKDLPDFLLRRRALRISEDLGAFCSFSQSVFDAWSKVSSGQGQHQEAVRAVMRLAEIQGWIRASLDAHVITVKKLRGLTSPQPPEDIEKRTAMLKIDSSEWDLV